MASEHRSFFASLPAIALLALAGCETTGSQATPPPTSPTTVRQAIVAAKRVEQGGEGRSSVLGGGTSMMPLYGEDTVIVYAPIAFEDLEAEMVVAYRNAQNKIVTHRLLKRSPKGWIAMGDNNRTLDDEYVTPDNLIGVVYTVLYTNTPTTAP
ncbi:MAG: S24/S26 family peptidase [Verrucomicrobiota bacterium JB022]|nr:S24/S26 family peptidase [Verrucomicrobiota bacterium JB022]